MDEANGGLYAMPFGFTLRAFVGDGDLLGNTSIDDKNWTWKEFEEISKKLGESGAERRYALAGDPPEFLIQEMIVDRYSEFVDHAAKKAKFDSPLFVEAMQQIKKMYDNKVMTSEAADIGKQMFYSTVLRSPADFINDLHLLLLQSEAAAKTGTKRWNENLSAIPVRHSSQIRGKEEAWKFIAFMLSEEGQSLQERQGFSLLKSVNEKQIERHSGTS